MNRRRTSSVSLLSPRRPLFWLGLAVIFCSPFLQTRPAIGNVQSDLAAIESLVERHTFYINQSTFADTIDKLWVGERAFSQKSPLFHVIAAIPYGVLHAMGFTLARDTALCLRVLTLLMVVLPMGALLWLIHSNPWVARHRPRDRFLFTLVFALASLMTPFAVTLNHYVAASACLMAAVNLLTAASMHRRSFSRARFSLTVGFWVSASLACDVPPAFIFGAGLGAVWIWRSLKDKGWSRLAWLAAGAAPLLLVYCALNTIIMGSILPPNLHEKAMLYVEGSFWAEQQARVEAGDPGYYWGFYGRRLFHSTLGHKGIYWMMPLLTLATLAAFALTRRRAGGWQLALCWAAFPPVTIAIVMHWARDLSGGAYLIRHALSTFPPLYCVLAHPRLGRPSTSLRAVAALGILWGGMIAWIGVLNPWSHNTLSAIPPLENAARLCLAHSRRLPTDWIQGLIRRTSAEPDIGWLDLGLERLDHAQQAARTPGAARSAVVRPLLQAEHALREAIAVRPSRPLPRYHLGIVLDMLERPADAIAVYDQLLAMEPGNLGAWNNLIVFALHAGRLDRAAQASARSAALAPGNPRALWGELMVEEKKGEIDANRPKLLEALRLHPDNLDLQALARRWGMRASPENKR